MQNETTVEGNVTLPNCPFCGMPCPLEDCITDAEGRAAHKECYRKAIIEGRKSL